MSKKTKSIKGKSNKRKSNKRKSNKRKNVKHGGVGNQNGEIKQRIKTATEEGNPLSLINNNRPKDNETTEVSKPNDTGFLYVEHRIGGNENRGGDGIEKKLFFCLALLAAGFTSIHFALSTT